MSRRAAVLGATGFDPRASAVAVGRGRLTNPATVTPVSLARGTSAARATPTGATGANSLALGGPTIPTAVTASAAGLGAALVKSNAKRTPQVAVKTPALESVAAGSAMEVDDLDEVSFDGHLHLEPWWTFARSRLT